MPKVIAVKNVALVLLADNTFKLVSTNLPVNFFPEALSEYGIPKDTAVFITAGIVTRRHEYFYIGTLRIGYLDSKGDFYIYPRSIRVFPREPIYNDVAVNAELYKTLLVNLKK